MTQLGVGLIGIGRKWGVVDSPVPSERETLQFLEGAYQLGLRYFDTAPAYGYSEERLGTWLGQLSPEQGSEITIATKFGEFWNFNTNESSRSYTFDDLKKSIDQSLKLLGKIDILQLHGTTLAVLHDFAGVQKAIEYAQSQGILRFGASISDPLAFAPVIEMEIFDVIQFPHNQLTPADQSLIHLAQEKQKFLVTNRPFGMGQLASRDREGKIAAYQFVLKDIHEGVVLTGTKSLDHLKDNLEIFQAAKKSLA
jgi:aryl-alcohol dehydrogenase-like predicted oxidoreductase